MWRVKGVKFEEQVWDGHAAECVDLKLRALIEEPPLNLQSRNSGSFMFGTRRCSWMAWHEVAVPLDCCLCWLYGLGFVC